jgi:hypothetical protein
MSSHSDDNDNLSQDDEDPDFEQREEEDFDNQQQNAFITDNADVHLLSQQQFEDVEPIEARPPDEIDADEQERQQSGTPAFRTLEDVRQHKISQHTFSLFYISAI